MSYSDGFKILRFLASEINFHVWDPAISGYTWLRNRLRHLPEHLAEFDVSIKTKSKKQCHLFFHFGTNTCTACVFLFFLFLCSFSISILNNIKLEFFSRVTNGFVNVYLTPNSKIFNNMVLISYYLWLTYLVVS